MAVSSPTGTGSETVTFPGRRLTGCRGWHRFFKLSIYRCGITLKTCSTPRVYILYLKSASNLNGNLNCSKELEHYAS